MTESGKIYGEMDMSTIWLYGNDKYEALDTIVLGKAKQTIYIDPALVHPEDTLPEE